MAKIKSLLFAIAVIETVSIAAARLQVTLFKKVSLVEGYRCFRGVCIEDNYLVEFDQAANQKNASYQNIWAGFYVNDIKEVNTEHHHVTFEIGLVLGWRDSRLTCKNQVFVELNKG